MEEMRSFGYICPECGKPVIASRSVFALTAAAARMECACEKSTLEVQTDGVKFRLWVPCGLCGKTHQAECAKHIANICINVNAVSLWIVFCKLCFPVF